MSNEFEVGYALPENDDIKLKLGITHLKREDGIMIVSVELTPNMFIILDRYGTPIIRMRMDALQWWNAQKND